MSAISEGISKLFYNKQGLINGLIVCLIMAALLVTLLFPESNVHKSKHLDFFWLVLLIDFVFALWIAWSMPTVRVVSLVIAGAFAGLCTEYTAKWAGLWMYERDCLHDSECLPTLQRLLHPHTVDPNLTGIGVESGILIYMLTAIALFGLVYIFNRILLKIPLMRSTGWANPIFVFLVFLGLCATVPKSYLTQIQGSLPVQIYYGLLFGAAATASYCMRKATVLSILIGASLVSFVGQYTGGSLAGIWVFQDWNVWSWLPSDPYPPVYLIIGIWPLEYMLEYGLSSIVADILVYKTQVTKTRVFQTEENGSERESQHVKIDYLNLKGHWIWPDMKSMIEFSRRSFLRMLRRNPEVGEVITALAGPLLAVFAAYEIAFHRFYFWQAAGIAALFAAALLVSPKMFDKRVAGFAFFGFVTGFSLMTGTELVHSPLKTKVGVVGNLFWGVLAFLVCMTIYGVSYLIIRRIVLLTDWKEQMKDKGEPSSAVAGAAVVLMVLLIVVLIFINSLFDIEIVSPPYYLFFVAVIAAFVFWWFYFAMPIFRSAVHSLVAILVVAGTLWFIPFQQQGAIGLSNPFQWLEGAVSYHAIVLFAYGLGLVLTYLFAYQASANLAGEPLSKGIRVTYWRSPHLMEKDKWTVRFHDSPGPDGIRRRLDNENGNKMLHTYPALISGVCTAAAEAEGERENEKGKELSIEETLRKVLGCLKGHWTTYDSEGKPDGSTDSLKEAIAGRKVFIKPNLVAPVGSPYTTQAELVAELIRYCRDAGATKIYVGETPLSNITSEMTMVATGLKDYWESLNEKSTGNKPDRLIEVVLLDESPFCRVSLEDAPDNQVKGVVFKEFSIPLELLDESVFYINVPKMKTHLQSSVTLGIKNSHGLVPECQRGTRHEMISQKVVDITKVWTPDLTVVDGYDGLEGIGPWPGDRVPSRILVASNDVVLADLVATQLMGKEELNDGNLDFNRSVQFKRKFVKTTWLGFEQGLGILEPEEVIQTWYPGPSVYSTWENFKTAHVIDFRRPEYRDEGLIKNIGYRFGQEPSFPECEPTFPGGTIPHAWDYAREFLPLSGNDPVVGGPKVLEATRTWGPVHLVADDFENPDLGASVMLSGVFGLLKELLEKHFTRELNILDGFVIVYGPLFKPLECEGVIMFGDRAIKTDHMVFSPKVFQVPGYGHPPNKYSDIFERISQEMGGQLIGYTTEVITFARGWYW